jgi:hypothetical protein
MEIIFEDKGLKAVYFKEKKRILFIVDGYLNIDAAKQMYMTVFGFMKTNHVVSFLNDLTSLKGTFTNLTKWLFENMQDMIKIGLKYDALVISNDIFTQFAANDFAKKSTHLELQIFNNLSEAEKWLEERENR